MNLRDSFKRDIDKKHVDEIAISNKISVIYTLIPNFYLLDPDHTFFPNVKYKPGHFYHGVKRK